MDWQLAVVAVLVGSAAAYLLRAGWRTVFGRGKAGCGGGCSCPVKPADEPERRQIFPAEQLRLIDRN